MSNDQLSLFASSAPSSPSDAPSSQRSSEPQTCSKKSRPSDATRGRKPRRARAKRMPGSVRDADGSTVVVVPTVDYGPQQPLPAITVRHTPDPYLSVPRPKTLADCRRGKEARPCPWFGCHAHLAMEEAAAAEEEPSPSTESEGDHESGPKRRPRTLRLNMPQRADEHRAGRRPGLSSSAAEALVKVWLDDALELASTMPYTCMYDVIEDFPDGLPASAVGRILGITEQAVEAEERKPEVREALRGLKETMLDG